LCDTVCRICCRRGSFAVTFLVAFVVYEAALLALFVGLFGGAEDFTGAIQGRIFVINAAAFIGLLALNRLAPTIGLVANTRVTLSTAARSA
jgi:hypothetical protein